MNACSCELMHCNLLCDVYIRGICKTYHLASTTNDYEKQWQHAKIFFLFFLFIWPLFNQESPIEIKNLFFEGVLAKRQQQITYIHSQYYTHNI